MTIETKFDLNEDVYIIKRVKVDASYKCNICEGKGLIYFKGESLICPKCEGVGSIDDPNNYMYEWQVISTKIYRVNPEVTKDCQIDRYSVLCNYGYTTDEDYIYKTEEDAIIECQKINKIEKQNRE